MRGAIIIGTTITTGSGMNIVISHRPLVSTGVWTLMFANLPRINHGSILMTWVTPGHFIFLRLFCLPMF
jgi:hypothetical protein